MRDITNHDKELTRRALQKLRAGILPTRDEERAKGRVERARDRHLRQRFYASIPKKDYLDLSQRQAKIINEQADRYGIPIPTGRGATIDLGELLRWLHDFLADNKSRLRASASDDPLLNGAVSPNLERYRGLRADLAELELSSQREQLISIDDLRDGWNMMASILRRAGDQLRKQFGKEAHRLLDEALDDAQRIITETLK